MVVVDPFPINLDFTDNITGVHWDGADRMFVVGTVSGDVIVSENSSAGMGDEPQWRVIELPGNTNNPSFWDQAPDIYSGAFDRKNKVFVVGGQQDDVYEYFDSFYVNQAPYIARSTDGHTWKRVTFPILQQSTEFPTEGGSLEHYWNNVEWMGYDQKTKTLHLAVRTLGKGFGGFIQENPQTVFFRSSDGGLRWTRYATLSYEGNKRSPQQYTALILKNDLSVRATGMPEPNSIVYARQKAFFSIPGGSPSETLNSFAYDAEVSFDKKKSWTTSRTGLGVTFYPGAIALAGGRIAEKESAAFGKGLIIALGYGSQSALTTALIKKTTNGRTWTTALSSPAFSRTGGVGFAREMFAAAIGTGGTHITIFTSKDGTKWNTSFSEDIGLDFNNYATVLITGTPRDWHPRQV